MINEYEVPDLIQSALPEIDAALLVNREKNNVYQAMQSLLQFTGSQIKAHNYKTVKQCFGIAEKLYEKGNRSVKNAVENVYVYSFGNMLNLEKTEKRLLLSIIPITLYSLYVHQLQASGC